jgi:AmmeMemoRadiSam system protein B
MNTHLRIRLWIVPGTFLAAALLLSSPAVLAAPRSLVVRPPAAMGTYYPEDPATLLKTVQDLVAAADAPEPAEAMVGCIASPAPYGLAGSVTAQAFKNLKPGQYDRVIILSAAHLADIENCSVEAVDAFVTPLGPVPLDEEAMRQILFSPLFTARSLSYVRRSKRPPVHEYEYGVEALLPYLQERLHEFKLVPILVGGLTDAGGKFNPSAVDAIARVLRPIVNDRTLVVASSSFTHFGNDFSNRPFNDNIIANIEHLDRQAFDCVLSLDMKCFVKYLDTTKNVIDGRHPIEILMKLMPPQASARILAYEVSASKTGDENRSVSYAAFTFHDPLRPALEARPDKVRPLPMRPVPAAQKPEAVPAENAPAAPAEAQPKPADNAANAPAKSVGSAAVPNGNAPAGKTTEKKKRNPWKTP